MPVEVTAGSFSLVQLILMWNLRRTESEAKAAVMNGLVKIDGDTVNNLNQRFVLSRIAELQVGTEVFVFTRTRRVPKKK